MATSWADLSVKGCSIAQLSLDMERNILYKITKNGVKIYSNDDSNTWIDHHVFNSVLPSSFMCGRFAVGAGDVIYVSDGNKDMKILKMEDNGTKFEEITDTLHTGTGVRAIMIRNDLHVIGGWDNHKHLKGNRKSNKWEILHERIVGMDCNCVGYHGLVKIKNRIMMLGGYGYDRGHTDKMYEYNILTDEWSKSDIKLPSKLCRFGCVSVIDDQYVIICGGETKGRGNVDDIWIYDVKHKTFRKSNIKCPKKDGYRAYVMNHKNINQMAVVGYVRREWRTSQIDEYLFPPKYLVRIMTKYCLKEELHLFDECNTSTHWKIDVFDIIS